MTITSKVRHKVRERANSACEYCGITEVELAGHLTIDHYQPKAKMGSDTLENLIYSCIRCNQYKSDYWPSTESDIFLWNPRREEFKQHFIIFEDGVLHPLTEIGSFTIERLRLNRKPLVSSRLNRARQTSKLRLLTRYSKLVKSLEELNTQQADLIEEQQNLLQMQQELLRLILGQDR